MKRSFLLLAVGAFAGAAALAQGPASAPGITPGMGGGMHGWRMNRDNTAGWSLMTRAERQAHQQQVAATKTYDECKAVVDRHRADLAERAKAQGRAMPAAPRMDPCARLKK
jgi:hypothetical protein